MPEFKSITVENIQSQTFAISEIGREIVTLAKPKVPLNTCDELANSVEQFCAGMSPEQRVMVFAFLFTRHARIFILQEMERERRELFNIKNKKN